MYQCIWLDICDPEVCVRVRQRDFIETPNMQLCLCTLLTYFILEFHQIQEQKLRCCLLLMVKYNFPWQTNRSQNHLTTF